MTCRIDVNFHAEEDSNPSCLSDLLMNLGSLDCSPIHPCHGAHFCCLTGFYAANMPLVGVAVASVTIFGLLCDVHACCFRPHVAVILEFEHTLSFWLINIPLCVRTFDPCQVTWTVSVRLISLTLLLVEY